MPKIVLMLSMSLDGYFEGPDHDISWHQVDEEVHTYFNDHLRGMGGFLHGRVTYELMADFWPTADADPQADRPMREFAGIWRDMPKVVYSRTLERADWNTTVARDVVPEEVRALKERADGDLVVGGVDLAQSFERLGLIDEYHVTVHPVLIGRGRPLFPPSDTKVPLRTLATHVFGNGVTVLRYARADARA